MNATQTEQTYFSGQCDVCRAYTSYCMKVGAQTRCKYCHARLTAPKPQVGDGATYSIGSDSYAYTVTRVTASGKTIWLKADRARATKNSDYYGVQRHVFVQNPDAKEEKATLRQDGYYRFVGSDCGSIRIGERRQHMDPHF